MPRIRTPATITQWYLFRVNKTEAAKKTGMPRGTLYRRLDHPGDLRLKELGQLVKLNDLTDEEIVTIVRAWE